MKVSIYRTEFIKSLTLGSSFSGKNKALNVLDYTKVSLKDGRCRISSNDGEVAITTSCGSVEGEEDAVFYVDAKKVVGALKSIKEEQLTLDVDEKNIVIKHKSGKFSIPLGNVDEFPVPTMDSENTEVNIPSKLLFEWVKVAKDFAGNDELRPVMTGIYIYVKNGELGVCASDGHKLFTDNIYMDALANIDVNAILSPKAVATLMTMINETVGTTVYFGERNVVFRTENTSIMCRNIEGRYPNFKAVIPNTHSIECEFKKSVYLESLNRVLLMAAESSLTKMTISGDDCKLLAEDLDFSQAGEDSFKLETPSNGNITIGYKGIFAHTCVNAIDNENVRVEMTSSDRAIVFRDPSNQNSVSLLMPMQC